MLPYRDSRLTKIALLTFFFVVIVYAYFEARGVLFGPRIAVPRETIETSEQFIVLRGTAERIAELRMNGAPIAVTETGAFEEPYVLAPGTNRIVFDATDTYGRSEQKVVTIYYGPTSSPQTIEAAATSTSDASPE